jgi:hypothetical protein
VDPTAQFLKQFKRPFPGQAFFEFTQVQPQAAEQQRKPQPVQPVWAPGSMERFAAQNKSS